MEIPKDGFVLSGHGKAGIWLALNIEKCCRVYIDGDMVRILPRITATWDKGYLSGENICRDEGFLVLYRNVASTGTNQYGVEVAVRNGTAISNPVYGQGNMSVPEGGFVLSGHGMAGSWLAANIAEGYIVDICNNTVSASLPEAKQEISVGSKVKVRDGAPTYDGTALAPFVYKRTHVVREIKGERAVITFCGIVVAAVRLSDLIPAE